MTINFNHQLIEQICGQASYRRGNHYYKGRQVLDVGIQSGANTWLIQSQVRGSHDYRQTITVNKSSNFFDGRCSCPVHVNCKHVAAALIFSLAHQLFDQQVATPDSVELWLDELDDLAQAPPPELSRSYSSYCLLYILQPAADDEFAIYVIPKKARILKKGGYGKATGYALNQFSYYNANQFLSQEDEEIAQLLDEQPDYNDYRYDHYQRNHRSHEGHRLKGDLGELALQKMLFSGRCHWLEKDSPALTIDQVRQLNFRWQDVDRGKQLAYQVVPEIAAIGQVNQLWYIDTSSGSMGPLASAGLSAEQMVKLINAPLVPEEKLATVSRRLLIDMPNFPLTPPVKLDIKEVHIGGVRPQFQLHLHSRTHHQDDAQDQSRHYAQLMFNYRSGSNSVALADYGVNKHTSCSEGNTIYRVERDRDAEFSAIEHLQQIGMILESQCDQFQPNYDSVINVNPEALIWLPEANTLLESVVIWHELISVELPKLAQQGWEIITDDSFTLSFEEAQHWHADLQESNSDWFSLSLGIECDGEKINLLPSIVQLLSELPGPQQLREYLQHQPYVLMKAADHRWIKLPSERLLPIFDTLIELYDSAPLNDDGTLSLSRHQSIQLSDLLNDPELSWHGAEQLKALNARLRNFAGIEAVEP
ncbi:MAG: SWIM zinc finger family protein, partial [Immundisolibacteraceae bacterium]|nr:SWIM zinc finger family protein [Immundisolibacteraceae bacterium]